MIMMIIIIMAIIIIIIMAIIIIVILMQTNIMGFARHRNVPSDPKYTRRRWGEEKLLSQIQRSVETLCWYFVRHFLFHF
jgi:hypothetical protein